MCGTTTSTSDENALLASFEKVIDTINQAAESFTSDLRRRPDAWRRAGFQ
jgi:hypothetical protein